LESNPPNQIGYKIDKLKQVPLFGGGIHYMKDKYKTKHVYVVELNKDISARKYFKKQNPDYQEGQPCVYVGMTGTSPKQRFKVHKSESSKGSRKVKRYGIKLMPEHFEHLNPMTWDEAVVVEKEMAQYFRSLGYGVIQS
jgi:hypothetical protein